ncbi:MAG TPA: universal stress protein [Methylocella sp.]|nr:universal stress protein [Methylocella sp.]
MYKNILIATDGSELAASAVEHGISLAKSVSANVIAVNVSEPFHWFAPDMIEDAEAAYIQAANQNAARILAAVAEAAKAAGVSCETVLVEEERPYKAIIDTANSKNCDLIVMASHGRHGISAMVLGSESVKVLTHSKIPVLICH